MIWPVVAGFVMFHQTSTFSEILDFSEVDRIRHHVNCPPVSVMGSVDSWKLFLEQKKGVCEI